MALDDKVKKTQALARSQAGALGHTLGRFHADQDGWAAFRDASCTRCGAKVVFNLIFLEHSFAGDALTAHCP